ncbi:MAG: zinc ribbon domain-containing protein [Syntrophaceae bacterium]|nr:zinc ribbon domain-containing protein [Syntrophaceae bacterium]
MPIYEYRCRKCNREFEEVQSITAPELKSCKFCKGPVTKLMSVSSFHLKGSGWYVTDYGGRKAPSSETAHKSETAAKSDAASEGSSSAGTPAAGDKS